jgi:hypothetical protein
MSFLYGVIIAPAVVLRRYVALWTLSIGYVLLSIASFAVVRPSGWEEVFKALPIVIVVILAIGVFCCRRSEAPLGARRLMLIIVPIFALMLLAKMALSVTIAKYGFALAMPATLLAAGAMLTWCSRATLPLVLLVVAVQLRVFVMLYADKPYRVSSGADAFYVRAGAIDPRGPAVNQVLDTLARLPKGATLAVVPEGVIINYLSQRTNPTKHINLMPPEVAMFGQQNILADFRAHPPDYMLLVLRSDATEYGYRSFDLDYGAQIVEWIRQNYEQVPATPVERQFPLMLLKRK